jgi:putative copper resistance protein D
MLVGVVAAALYLAGVRRVRRPWRAGRSIAFIAGCVVLALSALTSSSSFTGHMVEHVLIGMVAPVLLVLGAPITLALQASGPASARSLRRLLHSPGARVLTHPLVAWAIFGMTLVVLVFSPVLEWSVHHDAVHALVHLHFLLAGYLFVATMLVIDPIPRPLPHGARLLAILFAVPFHAIVGMALATASQPLFPSVYPSVSDQRSAAAVLWASGELFTLALAAIVGREWWLADQRAAARFDRAQQVPFEVRVADDAV